MIRIPPHSTQNESATLLFTKLILLPVHSVHYQILILNEKTLLYGHNGTIGRTMQCTSVANASNTRNIPSTYHHHTTFRKQTGRRTITVMTPCSVPQCPPSLVLFLHPRSSRDQSIIAAPNTVIATTNPTEHRSPPSDGPTSSVSSASTTDAVPTKLRN